MFLASSARDGVRISVALAGQACMAFAGFYWALGSVIPKHVTPRAAKISLFS
jgi:hypothetical protein